MISLENVWQGSTSNKITRIYYRCKIIYTPISLMMIMKKLYHTCNGNNIPVTLLFVLFTLPAVSQYYYKDLITVQQINKTYQVYKDNKVNKVVLNSYQGSVPVTEGFVCEQKVNISKNEVATYTKTLDIGESFFTAFYKPEGLLIKSIDSTEESVSTSVYEYNAARRLTAIHYTTHATDNSSNLTETHYWQYTTSGIPQKMLRIKNNNDTTVAILKTDEKGNVTEEDISGKTARHQKIYYYYDEKNRLTDVVQYNVKAKRLLPDYMFEYEDSNELSTMTIVPEGSSEYQKYYYKYDENGLKVIEFCYNKKNELLGKVQYSYTLGR